MLRRPVIIWIVLSYVVCLAGSVWRYFDTESQIAFLLYANGWVSTLLSIGYFSTPSNSIFGKVSFGCVIVLVAGIVAKVLHLPGANQIIVISLLGIAVTYLVMWFGKKESQ